MPKVTALKPHLKHPELVKVYLDQRYAFTVDALTVQVRGLQPGTVLTLEDVEEFRREGAHQRAYDAALRFLAARPRSEEEVRRRLSRVGWGEEVVGRVLDRLRSAGLVDDRAFVLFWLENRTQFNPKGSRALSAELRQKGIDPLLARELLAGQDEEEAALHALRRGIRRWRREGDFSGFRQRFGPYLARRGFSLDAINSALGQLWRELQESDQPSPL
ncbi:MAG: RecX family transcriptional regulator [Chloroflexi bacterium]|nr:RecX family transcriptional regulator [Chloroflexota bacterium]